MCEFQFQFSVFSFSLISVLVQFSISSDFCFDQFFCWCCLILFAQTLLVLRHKTPVMEESQASKYVVNVDLSKCGCDNVLSLEIAKHDRKDDESWNNSWVDLCGDVGNELKDDQWEEKYDLFDQNNKNPIEKLNQFKTVFENFTKSNSDKIVSFYVAVKLLPQNVRHYFLFFLFF